MSKDSLDWFIQKQVKDYQVPGVAVGIVKGDKIVLSKGYGYTSASDSVKVTAQTIFPIMSCTKAFTAAAIGMLVDEGKLKWNDKVIKFLPHFKLSDPHVTSQLTIADILSHRSGLETSEGDLLWYASGYSREEIINRIRYSPIKNRFRKDYGYQNVMYLVAGMIIKQVTGMSWDQFVQERIFEPLKMHHSSTSIKHIDSNRFALPHLMNTPVAPMNLDNIGPAGSINSTVSDMLKWAQLWLNEGQVNGAQLISRNSIHEMTSPKIWMSPKQETAYGFGWEINEGVISHGGGLPGYKSLLTIDKYNKIAVIVLTNKNSYINEELSGAILEFLKTDTLNWLQHDKKIVTRNFRFPWQEPHPLPAIDHSVVKDLMIYEGIYESRQYGKLVVNIIDDSLLVDFQPAAGKIKGYLSPAGKDTFNVVFNDPFIPSGKLIFTRDKRNRIDYFSFDIPKGDFVFDHLRFHRMNTRQDRSSLNDH
jgi:CubicO group peptidase (beta-lactamase class C family)